MNKINKGGHFSMTKRGQNSMTIDSNFRGGLKITMKIILIKA